MFVTMFAVSVGRFHIPDCGVLERHSHFTLLCIPDQQRQRQGKTRIVILGFIATQFVNGLWWMSADVMTLLPLR